MTRPRFTDQASPHMHLRHVGDEGVCSLMLHELDHDVQRGSVYLSSRLTDIGRVRWPDRLREALTSGSPESLAELIDADAILETHEPKGGGQPGLKRVPVNAAETLAQGEFNRYYMRALCMRALDGDGEVVEWCRARTSARPRTASQVREGRRVDAAKMLQDLRQGVNVASGPNSGMTLRIVPA